MRDLFFLPFQKDIDLSDKGRMCFLPGGCDSLLPLGIELSGQQPVGREDHTPATLPNQLNDECITAVSGAFSDVEHRLDAHIGTFDVCMRFFSVNHGTTFLTGYSFWKPQSRYFDTEKIQTSKRHSGNKSQCVLSIGSMDQHEMRFYHLIFVLALCVRNRKYEVRVTWTRQRDSCRTQFAPEGINSFGSVKFIGQDRS